MIHLRVTYKPITYLLTHFIVTTVFITEDWVHFKFRRNEMGKR